MIELKWSGHGAFVRVRVAEDDFPDSAARQPDVREVEECVGRLDARVFAVEGAVVDVQWRAFSMAHENVEGIGADERNSLSVWLILRLER